MDNKLLQLFLTSPHGLSTPVRLYEAAKKEKFPVTLNYIKNMMKKWELANKFKKKYIIQSKSEKAIIPGPYYLFQLDLCFFSKYKNYIGCLMW